MGYQQSGIIRTVSQHYACIADKIDSAINAVN